jgi:hypothetical protein
VAWILRLVKIGAEGEVRSVDVMEINRSDDLGNIAAMVVADDQSLLRKPYSCKQVARRICDAILEREHCLLG